MADTGQEKSERPSEKKLKEGREKGQVAKSIEINSLAVFSTGLIFIFLTKDTFSGKIAGFGRNIFSNLDKLEVNRDVIAGFIQDTALSFFSIVAPIFAILFVMAFVANVAQVGFQFSTKALAPKFNKMNPFTNIKRIFFSSRSLTEVAKSLIKLFIIGLFTYNILYDFSLKSTKLIELNIPEIVSFMVDAAYALIWRIVLVFALIAAVDFGFQRFKFMQDMMMSKQDVKDENKESEGNPQIKSRIRKIQYSMARNRMMKQVPTADVVITNPTHFAVALKYELRKDAAPKVVAKGADEIAKRIKKIAAENNIPVHEDKMLARALYKLCDVGDVIPPDLFKAVAKILAYVFQLKNKKKKSIV